MTREELNQEFGIDESVNMFYSEEMNQDIEFNMRRLTKIKSKDFTEEELRDWSVINYRGGFSGSCKSSEPTDQEVSEWDLVLYGAAKGEILTEDPTAEEVESWMNTYGVLKTLDTEAVKKKYGVRVETDFVPYESYEDRWATFFAEE